MVESNVTRSPSANSVTRAPSLAILPAASWPMTMGGMRRPDDPSYPWTSLPQMPHAATRTRTSPGPGAGSGKSAISKCLYRESRRAFMRYLHPFGASRSIGPYLNVHPMLPERTCPRSRRAGYQEIVLDCLEDAPSRTSPALCHTLIVTLAQRPRWPARPERPSPDSPSAFAAPSRQGSAPALRPHAEGSADARRSSRRGSLCHSPERRTMGRWRRTPARVLSRVPDREQSDAWQSRRTASRLPCPAATPDRNLSSNRWAADVSIVRWPRDPA